MVRIKPVHVLSAALGALLAAYCGWRLYQVAAFVSGPRDAQSAELPPPVVAIGLGRLEGPRDSATTSERTRRDVFDFGREAAAATPIPVPVAAAATPPPLPIEPTPVPLPPLQVRYIGAVRAPQGEWIAALTTDKKDLLTGKEGETLANRLRIVKIGIESIDVFDLGTGLQRRIRLGGT